MKAIRYCYIFLSFFLFFVLSSQVYANGNTGTGETQKTLPPQAENIEKKSAPEAPTEQKSLNEMQESIRNLEGQKQSLDAGWEKYRNEKGNITDFLKDDLLPEEKESLSVLLQDYFSDIEGNRNSIEARKVFFTELEKYVPEEKKSMFYEYRDTGFSFEIQKQQIEIEIQAIETQKEERTAALKEQISQNSNERRQVIRGRIEPLLRSRIEVFISSPSFQEIPNERKSLVFSRILSKVQLQKTELETSSIQTSVVQDRILTFMIIEEIMLEYMQVWQ